MRHPTQVRSYGDDAEVSEALICWAETGPRRLGEIVQRVRDGRLRTNIGNVASLDDAVAASKPTERRIGKTIIRIRP
jgi:hypothetical protein